LNTSAEVNPKKMDAKDQFMPDGEGILMLARELEEAVSQTSERIIKELGKAEEQFSEHVQSRMQEWFGKLSVQIEDEIMEPLQEDVKGLHSSVELFHEQVEDWQGEVEETCDEVRSALDNAITISEDIQERVYESQEVCLEVADEIEGGVEDVLGLADEAVGDVEEEVIEEVETVEEAIDDTIEQVLGSSVQSQMDTIQTEIETNLVAAIDEVAGHVLEGLEDLRDQLQSSSSEAEAERDALQPILDELDEAVDLVRDGAEHVMDVADEIL